MASNFQEVHQELLEKFDQIEGEYQAQGDEQDSLARMEIRYSGNTKYEKLQDGKSSLNGRRTVTVSVTDVTILSSTSYFLIESKCHHYH